jgi:hypothetical protein
MKWIRKLLGLCEHQWKLLNKIQVYDYFYTVYIADDYILQCEKCGTVKRKRF